jgi:hypothetical protein
LAPLNPVERRILEAAAVLGEHSTSSMIGLMTGSGSEQVIDAPLGLMYRDLLRRGHRGRLALRHRLVRELVHESRPDRCGPRPGRGTRPRERRPP